MIARVKHKNFFNALQRAYEKSQIVNLNIHIAISCNYKPCEMACLKVIYTVKIEVQQKSLLAHEFERSENE